MSYLLGYRKLVAFLLCLVSVVVLALLNINQETPYWTIVGLLTVFVGGNWAETVNKFKKARLSNNSEANK